MPIPSQDEPLTNRLVVTDINKGTKSKQNRAQNGKRRKVKSQQKVKADKVKATKSKSQKVMGPPRFIGYSTNFVAYTVYNGRTKKIIETMNVTFDELSAMAFEQNSSRPGLQSMTSGQISSELELTYAPSTITPQRPSERDLDILFETLHNEYLGGRPSEEPRTIHAAPVIQNLQVPTASMSIQDSALAPTNSLNTPVFLHNVDAPSQQHAQQQRNLTSSPTASVDNVLNTVFEGDLFANLFATPSTESVVSFTQYVDPSNMHTFYQPYPYDYQWTKDHPLEQVIGEPSRPVLTRNQLKTDGVF
nr:hypothetical protein [Tanacetum cinerariifolium]